MATTNLPLIGITTYGRNEEGDYTLPAEYVDAVRRAGGIPLLIPPGEPNLEPVLAVLDGLVLSGGGDLDPSHYASAGHPAIYMVDAERDAFELALARCAAEQPLPTLCICRGLQVLNVALGGSLVEHLPDEVDGSIGHRLEPDKPTRHPIAVLPGRRLATLLEAQEVEAVSWHHQAIRRLADPLAVAAQAADGVIEAVELPDHPWLIGVQWHPEMSAAHDPRQQRIFDALVAAAAERKRSRGA
ncbi:MAG TPA: gamma-glutamyl-gamma-aminobutyrate hydrolase family protein [Caldilineaceae bacterium]|nr:gamma-glutamyl-gamma-aminobutyrate hydrolase family protein [Caldilineaceae bacterium]